MAVGFLPVVIMKNQDILVPILHLYKKTEIVFCVNIFVSTGDICKCKCAGKSQLLKVPLN